jgi:hypothetical protein
MSKRNPFCSWDVEYRGGEAPKRHFKSNIPFQSSAIFLRFSLCFCTGTVGVVAISAQMGLPAPADRAVLLLL